MSIRASHVSLNQGIRPFSATYTNSSLIPFAGSFYSAGKEPAGEALPSNGASLYPAGKPRVMDIDGLTLIVERIPGAKTTSIQVYVKAGSYSDNSALSRNGETLNGLAHVVEHGVFLMGKELSFEGYLNSARRLDGEINGSTYVPFTLFSLDVPSHNINGALDLISNLYFNFYPNLINWEELKNEIDTTITNEINLFTMAHAPTVLDYLQRALEYKVWEPHKIFSPNGGTPETLSKIDFNDVATFLYKHYTRDNTIISVAGDCNPDEVYEQIKKHKNKLQQAGEKQQIDPFKYKQSLHLEVVDHPVSPVVVAAEGPSFNDPQEIYALNALAHELPWHFVTKRSSKREIGYLTGAEIKAGHLQFSGSLISLMLFPNNKDLEAALETVGRLLQEVKEKGLEANDLEQTKRHLKRDLLRLFELPAGRAKYNATCLLALDRVVPLSERIDGISRITNQDIASVARTVFNEEKVSMGIMSDREREIRLPL